MKKAGRRRERVGEKKWREEGNERWAMRGEGNGRKGGRKEGNSKVRDVVVVDGFVPVKKRFLSLKIPLPPLVASPRDPSRLCFVSTSPSPFNFFHSISPTLVHATQFSFTNSFSSFRGKDASKYLPVIEAL